MVQSGAQLCSGARVKGLHIVGRGEQYLRTAHPGGYRDHIEQNGGLIHKHRVVLPAAGFHGNYLILRM